MAVFWKLTFSFLFVTIIYPYNLSASNDGILGNVSTAISAISITIPMSISTKSSRDALDTLSKLGFFKENGSFDIYTNFIPSQRYRVLAIGSGENRSFEVKNKSEKVKYKLFFNDDPERPTEKAFLANEPLKELLSKKEAHKNSKPNARLRVNFENTHTNEFQDPLLGNVSLLILAE